MALVGRRRRGVLVVDRGVLRRPLRRSPRRGAVRRPDAGRALVLRRHAVLSRAHLPRPRRRRGGGPPCLRAAPASGDDVGAVARAHRAHPGGPARARRRPRRPRRRVHPEHPRDRGGVSRHGRPRRDLVVVLAGLRRALGHRPLRADRAGGAARRRRLPLRRARLRPQRGGRGDPRAGRRAARAARLPRRQRLGGRLSRRRGRGSAARARAGRLRPPALRPVLQRHDRPAEGDRPRPRRDPARAAQAPEPAPRHARGRPRVLVHDDRLDDVELPRRRAADAGLDRALRRQPGGADASTGCGSWRPRRASRASGRARRSSPAA